MAFEWLPWRRPSLPDVRQIEHNVAQIQQTAPVPCLWLFGKTGSGKTSVIHYLTGAEEAVIGEGFRPETKTSRRFDFPNSDDPLLCFLDTRGLAEASYDPSEDIARFSRSTQMLIVTVRVADQALAQVLNPLRQIRRESPQTPVLLALTCLHEATGQVDLTDGPDPFLAPHDGLPLPETAGGTPGPIPKSLEILLASKASQFAGLYDAIIPIDLTPLEEGYADPEFGGDRLKKAILAHLPHAYRQALRALNRSDDRQLSQLQRQSKWQVLKSSAMAATAGLVPVPWVDIPAVLGIQAHMAARIAAIYDQELTPARWALLSSAAGTRIAIRLALREILKLIPVFGMAMGAAGAFAFTYALGMSWDWYFASLQRGNVPSAQELKQEFATQLQRGHDLWRAE